jgi:hypothetical protein
VIATTQSFDQLARAFVAKGYVREGDLLRAGPKALTPTSAMVVAGAPGLVVLAYSPSVARAALASTNGITGPMRELAAWVNAPVVTVSGHAPPGVNGSPPCLDAIAYTDDVIDHRERIVFVTESPDADLVAVEGRLAEAEPVIEGRYVTIATTYDDEHSAANLVTNGTGMPEGSGLYTCP